MAKKAKVGFVSDFRRFFFRGLATLLPTVLTIYVLVKCFEFIQQNISVHITSGAVWVVVKATNDYPHIPLEGITLSEKEKLEYFSELGLTKEHDIDSVGAQEAMVVAKHEDLRMVEMRKEWNKGPRSLVGFGVAVILVYILGRVLASFLGRKLWQIFERSVGRIPGFKQVYPHVKQVVELVLGEKAMAFSTVVLVEYPSRDIWTIGFLTGDSMKAVDDAAGGVTVSVFIPTSPTPFTGFTINLKREKVRVMDIPVEQALRFVLTAGVLAPDRNEQDVSSKPLELGTVAVIPAGGSDSHDGVDVDGSDSEDGDAG
ncbi:MAG: DUF502 domain-containing protein [Planctomycetes bacterium]|nr:DUF502 domain-containing protein [Planctomycetota bacterium]